MLASGSASLATQTNLSNIGNLIAAALLTLLSACSTPPASTTLPPLPLSDLAPTGKLRVGIGIGNAGSAFWATKDPITGQPKEVTIDLGIDIAQKLGVPLAFIIYNNSGEVTAAGPLGEWDVAFMPVDGERAKMVDFGPAYALVEST